MRFDYPVMIVVAVAVATGLGVAYRALHRTRARNLAALGVGRATPLRQHVQPLDRGDRLVVVPGRRAGGQRALVEGDHADVDRVGLRLDEPRRRGLCGGQAGGCGVRRRHAVRDVEGEDHGTGGPRHPDRGVRPRHGQQQQADRDEEQQRRHVLAQRRGPADAQRGQVARPGAVQGAVGHAEAGRDRHSDHDHDRIVEPHAGSSLRCGPA